MWSEIQGGELDRALQGAGERQNAKSHRTWRISYFDARTSFDFYPGFVAGLHVGGVSRRGRRRIFPAAEKAVAGAFIDRPASYVLPAVFIFSLVGSTVAVMRASLPP